MRKIMRAGLTGLLVVGAAVVLPLAAQEKPQDGARGEKIVLDGHEFSSWEEVGRSGYFHDEARHCATPDRDMAKLLFGEGNPSDCSSGSNNPDPSYNTATAYEIPVVVHIIMNTSGTGALTDQQVQSQIDILNEDFQALAGTNGANGNNVRVRFKLATTDPAGNATTGITRTTNDSWFNDSGTYYNTLAWNPNNYLNIYTNNASGALGYVPFFPQSGQAGTNADRVVILYSSFGRNAPLVPYDQGRTATHEVGHYLGLYHTFQGGCASATMPTCYTTGDLICDTNSEQSPRFGCPAGATSCSSLDPITNYMDYTDDLCMEEFTPEQALRIRCTLLNYRPNLASALNEVFSDGFESGNVSAWTLASP